MALEMTRRATPTLILVRTEAELWPASLAGLLAAQLPKWLPGPCSTPTSEGEASATPLVPAYLDPSSPQPRARRGSSWPAARILSRRGRPG
jgi:hypothetical protein